MPIINILKYLTLASAMGAALVTFNSAHAGTLSLPQLITNNATSGISSTNTNTHAVNMGGGAVTINGVTFAAGGTTGTGYSTTEFAGATSGNFSEFPNPGDAVATMFDPFRFGNVGQTLTITGLTPGQTYDARIYYREWVTDTNRSTLIRFDEDGAGPLSASVTVNQDATQQAFYLSYIFTATNAPLSVSFAGASGNTGASFHLSGFSVQTSGPPELTTLNPADNATGVAVGANLVATFTKPIAIGTGNITIKNLTDGINTPIAVTDTTQVSISGAVLTINPTANLLPAKNYAIRIAGTAIDDTVGNSFAGITNDTTWNFTTQDPDTTLPVISSLSPADNANEVFIDTNLVVTFSEAITKGTGNITIKNLTDATQTTIAVTDTTQVSISGSVMTINPTADLVNGKNYAIQIAATAIDDLAGNSFPGVIDDTTWNFSVPQFPFGSWTYSGSMFILTTPDGANMTTGPAETNFPLLVRFNSGNFPFNQAAADGSDIRFATASGLVLSYQIEQWDSVNGRAAVWVKIPSIAANARQEIKVHWGKTGVASQSNGSSVFNTSNGYASVHHLGDTLADTVGTTSPTNSGTTATNGLIGRARTFASGQGIQCGTAITGLPSGSGPFSTSVWIRTSTFGKVALGWGVQDGGSKVVMNLLSPPRINVDCYFGGGSIEGSAAIPSSEWTHVTHTFQTTGTRLYVNGVLDASTGGGSMSLPTTGRLDIGGFVPTSDGFNFVGDMDEVRISNVVRSANWVKLEYENQKPVQTLAGGIVPSGSNFSVTPTSVTMNEVSTATLTAQAGGAQKVYWIYKKNGQESVLATDQLTFNYTAPRISANDSAIIQFKAVFAGGTQPIDVPLTVIDTVPDPVFTLVPSTTSWDGRSIMTVTANITNLAAMQAAGFGTLNYKWSVSGVAVTKQTSNGTLTLTRSQGSGPMTASLTIDNGGTPILQSAVINVQEPASDPWVQPTPAADEKPVNKQFFARDPGTGLGTIFYKGTQAAPATEVYLKIYTTNTGADVLYATHRQNLVATAYSFAVPIAAGKVTYKVTYGTTTGGNDSAPLATVTDLVCGDAFIIEGQSNALAVDNTAPDDTTTTNKWIRTYGLTSFWGYAISKGNDLQLGLWGWYLANRLVANNNMPICIINGAAGGTRIDMHRPNPANHALPLGSGWSEDIYANLYNRVVGAKLTHGIRGLLWHQGEQDQGAIGPDGDYNYKFYQQYFVDISAAWKQDFPNLRNYYIYQIWPAACGETSRNDQLREVQRTLPYLYSNMKIMSTHGIVPGSGCHYEPDGYQVFSDLIGPLVEQDVYGVMPTAKLTAPNLQRAYFTTPAKTEIALVFDQNVAWNPGAPTMLFMANAAGATSGTVSSGSTTGNTIKLQVSGATSAATITYLKGLVSWQQPNLLYGTNGIAALTFADVPIGTLSPYEIWAGGSFANAFTDKDPSHDPDLDGMTNQEEFAFGLDPTTGSSVDPITRELDKATGIFKYTRTKDSGFTYKVYYSTNLSGWTWDAAATQSPSAAVAGIETVTVTWPPLCRVVTSCSCAWKRPQRPDTSWTFSYLNSTPQLPYPAAFTSSFLESKLVHDKPIHSASQSASPDASARSLHRARATTGTGTRRATSSSASPSATTWWTC
ncbi:MAG: DUF2341 domain-containing protein [Verrucomicrobia bacterium]|nr:DUF2341 domain-containing protein [Verrucomicrobiota bacterium]